MSITVPIRRMPSRPFQRPRPKPEFTLMAAAQMAQEGKFGQVREPSPGDAFASIQPQEPQES